MLDFRIETFLAVCQTMNFTRAAEQLHITQPAVSQHIRALEEQYGTRLFQHRGKQLRLTAGGELLLRTAATMRHDALRLRELMRQADVRRTLRFGATLTIGEYILPGPLLRLLRQDPELRLRMLMANTRELLGLIDQGELDFAIVEGDFDHRVYDSLVYCTQRYIPVCAPGYSFPRPIRHIEDLLDVRLLVREPGSGTRNVLERALEARGLGVESFRQVTELGSLNLIKTLVCAGAGISFFYRPVVQAELDAGALREIRLAGGGIRHDFAFLWRRGSVFAPQYREIFSLLRQGDFLRQTVDEAAETLHNENGKRRKAGIAVIQDIAPHRYDNAYRPRPPRSGDRILFYQDAGTLLSRATGLPFTWDEAAALADLSGLPMTYLFAVDDVGFHWCHVTPSAVAQAASAASNGDFRGMEPGWLAFACITASQLHGWYHDHQFCGRCGAPAREDDVERAMRCPFCGNLVYPTIAPAVIVAVTHGDRLLLTKYARSMNARSYALIAGFNEIGEPLEDTVRREVMEEVGLPVKNIRFYKSQPWSFSGSLLAGFYCDLDTDDETVTLQRDELGEGTWFDRDSIPAGASTISLTQEMIDRFRQGPV